MRYSLNWCIRQCAALEMRDELGDSLHPHLKVENDFLTAVMASRLAEIMEYMPRMQQIIPNNNAATTGIHDWCQEWSNESEHKYNPNWCVDQIKGNHQDELDAKDYKDLTKQLFKYIKAAKEQLDSARNILQEQNAGQKEVHDWIEQYSPTKQKEAN